MYSCTHLRMYLIKINRITLYTCCRVLLIFYSYICLLDCSFVLYSLNCFVCIHKRKVFDVITSLRSLDRGPGWKNVTSHATPTAQFLSLGIQGRDTDRSTSCRHAGSLGRRRTLSRQFHGTIVDRTSFFFISHFCTHRV